MFDDSDFETPALPGEEPLPDEDLHNKYENFDARRKLEIYLEDKWLRNQLEDFLLNDGSSDIAHK